MFQHDSVIQIYPNFKPIVINRRPGRLRTEFVWVFEWWGASGNCCLRKGSRRKQLIQFFSEGLRGLFPARFLVLSQVCLFFFSAGLLRDFREDL